VDEGYDDARDRNTFSIKDPSLRRSISSCWLRPSFTHERKELIIAYKLFRICFVFMSFLIASLLLAACGGKVSGEIELRGSPSIDSVDELGEVEAREPEFEGATFEEAELLDDFPFSFPMPDGTRIASNIATTRENEFRVFLSTTLSNEDALTFYLQALPANGWTIDEHEETFGGTELKFSRPEWLGQILFVADDTSVGLDVHLYPPETTQPAPELGNDFDQLQTLGESESEFPRDMPLPVEFTPIELNDTLGGQGYQLAFTYPNMAEMAIVELSTALGTTGWEITDPTVDAMNGAYFIPFTNPVSGFQGYAYITRDPGQFGVNAPGAALIALAPGQP
jgi:hypothetical protein